MKKNVYCLIDTETARMTDVYNLGMIIFDKKGNILFEREYINTDIFENSELMSSAYYAYKMPLYDEKLDSVYCDTKSMMKDFSKS